MGVENLLYGPPEYARLGPYGAEEAACTLLGYTDGGVSINNSKEFEERFVDQVLGPVEVNLTRATKELKIVLAEASLENIRLALGLPASALSGGVLSVGENEGKPGDPVAKYTAYFKGPGPNGGTRHVWIPKLYAKSDVPIAMAKANGNIEITFGILQDPTQAPNEQWYKVTDVAGDPTPLTVTSTNPADPATNFAKSGNIVITFSRRVQAGYVNDTYFKLIKSTDGTAVAGVLTQSSDGKSITFNPVEDLAASTAYLFVASKGIRDILGNALAADTIINITTAA